MKSINNKWPMGPVQVATLRHMVSNQDGLSCKDLMKMLDDEGYIAGYCDSQAYNLIKRLLLRGYIALKYTRKDCVFGGRPRSYYCATRTGLKALESYNTKNTETQNGIGR